MVYKMKTTVMDKIPKCDICKKNDASFDCKTVYGSWGHLCKPCFRDYGTPIGTVLEKRQEVPVQVKATKKHMSDYMSHVEYLQKSLMDSVIKCPVCQNLLEADCPKCVECGLINNFQI